MKKSFILYTDQREVVETLSDESAGRLIKAIFTYVHGDTPEVGKKLLPVFIFFKQQLDRDFQKWNNIVKRNQENIKKRYQKLPKTTKSTSGRTGIPKALDNDTDNDNDILGVWGYYTTTYKTKEKLTPLRKTKITARLKTFTADEIKKAIDNAHADKFYSGDNDKGWKADFDWIFKSDEHIDRLLNLKPRKRPGLTDEEIEKRII